MIVKRQGNFLGGNFSWGIVGLEVRCCNQSYALKRLQNLIACGCKKKVVARRVSFSLKMWEVFVSSKCWNYWEVCQKNDGENFGSYLNYFFSVGISS